MMDKIVCTKHRKDVELIIVKIIFILFFFCYYCTLVNRLVASCKVCYLAGSWSSVKFVDSVLHHR